MVHKKFKYTGQDWQKRAIIALIGQVHQALDCRVRVSDVAVWMNVSKQTARKHLNEWCKRGILSQVKHRNRHEYQLTDKYFGDYLDGVFKPDYLAYMRYETRSIYD